MELSATDLAVLGRIALEIAGEGDGEVFRVLKLGFELYGECVEDREAYFKEKAKRLLENFRYAGKDSRIFYEQREHLKNILRRLGVSLREVDEVVDSAIYKFFKFKYAEGYNPLRSSWGYYISIALRRIVASFFEKRRRDPVARGFYYQQHELKGEKNDGFLLELYEVNQGGSVEEKLMLKEVLEDFEEFLRKKRSFRTGVISRQRLVCTLLPPGVHGHKINGSVRAFFVRKGKDHHRVEFVDGTSQLWESDKVIDIKINPDFEGIRDEDRICRSRLAVYRFIMEEGAQVEELESYFKVGSSTVHAWIRHLEEDFKEWWLLSDAIPKSMKYLAKAFRRCCVCKEEHILLPGVSTHLGVVERREGKELIWRAPHNGEVGVSVLGRWCDECFGCIVDQQEEKCEIVFPWGNVRGSFDLVRRAEKYREPIRVPICAF